MGKCRPERLRLSDKSVDGECSFQFDRCVKVGRSPWVCLLAAVRIHPFIFLYQIGPQIVSSLSKRISIKLLCKRVSGYNHTTSYTYMQTNFDKHTHSDTYTLMHLVTLENLFI